MSTTPQSDPNVGQTTLKTPDGRWIVTTTTTIDPVDHNPSGGIVIPENAKTSGILDDFAHWKQEKDAGTPGTASSISNKYIDEANGRQFYAVQKDHAGVRWSTNFAKDSAATNFVYDLTVKMADPTQIGQLELDMNQVLDDQRNVFLCVQANFKSKVWDYTLTPGNACHWYPSNIAVNQVDWKANVWKHIRIKTSHDSKGVVTYEGLELDGVYVQFSPSCKGVSAFKPTPPWTPGSLINNYQTNGANTSGTMDTHARQMQVFYW